MAGPDRRLVLAGLAASIAAPPLARAASLRDGAGRDVPVPAKVERVFPAGPPAAILLYTLAPDLLLGWPRANRPEEREFLLPGVGDKPEIGRITGRGNSANLEAVLGLKPDLIVDAGSTGRTYVELAARVQEQTGIPYALLDGRFDQIPASYRVLGQLTGRMERAETLARWCETAMATITGRVAALPAEARPSVYYARGPRGLETGLGDSINVETLSFLGARNVAADTPGSGLAQVSLEQVLAWDPEVIVTIDLAFAESRAQRSVLGRCPGGEGRPCPSLAEAALRLGRFPAFRQPHDRALVAGEAALSGAVPRGHPPDRARIPHTVLSGDAERGAARPHPGGAGVMQRPPAVHSRS